MIKNVFLTATLVGWISWLWPWLSPPLMIVQHILEQWARIKDNIVFCRVRQVEAPGRNCWLRLHACLCLLIFLYCC